MNGGLLQIPEISEKFIYVGVGNTKIQIRDD